LAPRHFTENLHGEDAFQGFVVEEELHTGLSRYQHIEIFQTPRFGRVLVLDGIVQTTERDEFMYHEMLVHVPIFACRSPRDILIIGGGDGGSLREVLRHDIGRVDMVEIDEQVVTACIEHLPTLNEAGAVYKDPRVNLIFDDAYTYLRREKRHYDVIICDSTDPVGAGEILFTHDFYASCKAALNQAGTLSLQNGVAFLQSEESHNTMRALRRLNLMAKCYQVAVPTYYGGSMVLAFGTRDSIAFNPSLVQLTQRFEQMAAPLKHYTPAHHLASFVLPRWIQEITGECDDSSNA